jgi:hypothetical protein
VRCGGGVVVNASAGALDEVLGPSSAPPRGCGGGSMKNKALQILADALGAISPQMHRSFID